VNSACEVAREKRKISLSSQLATHEKPNLTSTIVVHNFQHVQLFSMFQDLELV
jgi:hypothetical protein